jgi:hypothetical protein
MGMNALQNTSQQRSVCPAKVRAWMMLALGLGLVWVMAHVVLPWGQRLPAIGPIMDIIEQADIDAGAYWYTQSEETARAQMYVRHAIRQYEEPPKGSVRAASPARTDQK